MSMTVNAPTGYRIEPIDPATASLDLERQIVRMMQIIDHEEVPEDPKPPYEAMRAQFRMTSPFREMRWFGAFHEDRLAGGGVLGIDKSGANEHVRQVYLQVLPEHRRKGVAKAVFARVLEEIGDEKGIILHTWTSTRVPGGPAFATRVGAEAGLTMRSNQLDMSQLDRELMREWARRDPAGYRLEWIEGDIPERLMANAVTAMETMNTMPREGLQMEDFKVTPEIIRDRERMRKERGVHALMLLAIEAATGKTAAFTEVHVDERTPTVMWQGGTATVPEHRGKGLGKWVKGRMIVRVFEQRPEVRYVRTNNAGSNAAMLAINTQMGFRHVWDNIVFQVPLEKALEYVRG